MIQKVMVEQGEGQKLARFSRFRPEEPVGAGVGVGEDPTLLVATGAAHTSTF